MTGESILVVEDNGIIALQTVELLEKNGYRIAGTTAFGKEAVAMATKSPPDLICMDIELMGKIDGIETARKIKATLQRITAIIQFTGEYEEIGVGPHCGTIAADLLKPRNSRPDLDRLW